MSWSREAPNEPGIYHARIDWAGETLASVVQVDDDDHWTEGFYGYESVHYDCADAVIWFGPRIEPPAWPRMESDPSQTSAP